MSKEKFSFREWMKQPYPAVKDPLSALKPAFLFGAFVFIFLLIFQPFGLGNITGGIVYVCLGYGLGTFTVMVLLNAAFPFLLPSFFAEERWTVKKELIWNVINIFFIGLVNCFYSIYLGMAAMNMKSVLLFESYTLAVGIIPVTVAILVKESQRKKHFTEESQILNSSIEKRPVTQMTGPVKKIKLSSENQNDSFELMPEQLLYLASSDNYVEVFYLENNMVRKRLLRTPLKSVCNHLTDHPLIYRCHKSYAVNLQQVIRVSGNAQGYKLHLKQTETTIPVSRTNNTAIKEFFSR